MGFGGDWGGGLVVCLFGFLKHSLLSSHNFNRSVCEEGHLKIMTQQR